MTEWVNKYKQSLIKKNIQLLLEVVGVKPIQPLPREDLRLWMLELPSKVLQKRSFVSPHIYILFELEADWRLYTSRTLDLPWIYHTLYHMNSTVEHTGQSLPSDNTWTWDRKQVINFNAHRDLKP